MRPSQPSIQPAWWTEHSAALESTLEILQSITAQCAEHRHKETGNCSHKLSTWCISGLLLGFCRPDSSLALCRWTGRKEDIMAIPVMCLRQLLQDVNGFLTELCSRELKCNLQRAVVIGSLSLMFQVLWGDILPLKNQTSSCFFCLFFLCLVELYVSVFMDSRYKTHIAIFSPGYNKPWDNSPFKYKETFQIILFFLKPTLGSKNIKCLTQKKRVFVGSSRGFT